MEIKKGLLVEILEAKGVSNCSNGGISANWKTVLLVGPDIPEIFDNRDGTPCVMLKVRPELGNYVNAMPIDTCADGSRNWKMGGAFIWSYDSRFPHDYPIPLHDREENI